jgi:hypothetical protein
VITGLALRIVGPLAVVAESPQVPPPAPELMKPPPSDSYSERARSDIAQWLKTLTDLWARHAACRTTPQGCA